MSSQIKPSVTNPTIADLYEKISDGKLVLDPDFQRRFVWTSDHQESFIETILKGFPFPEVYICEGEVDIKKLKTTKHVIDGQQRLTTIKNYIEGAHEKNPTIVPLYQNLSDDQKKDFLTYQVVMRDIGKVDEATVREIFRRINITKFKLDNIEIHNAIYDGHFIKTAKNILDNIEFKDYGVFKDSEFTRMADLHFILLVMATVENGGYFAQDKEVEIKIASFNENYPNQNKTRDQIVGAFNIISQLELPLDSIWFRKGNFFTLIVEIAMNLNQIPKDFKDNLLEFEKNVLENKKHTGSEFGIYYHHMYQATHGRTARVTRSNYFKKYCLKK